MNTKIKYVEAMTGHGGGGLSPSEITVTSVSVPSKVRDRIINGIQAFITKSSGISGIEATEIEAIADVAVDEVEANCGNLAFEFDQDAPDDSYVQLESLGTGRSVADQIQYTFLTAEPVAIIRLEDLQRLIANQVPECERVEAAVA